MWWRVRAAMAPAFLKLNFEPGWELRRRQYGARGLGHLYLYRESAEQEVASAGVN